MIECPSCGHENVPGTQFCEGCGEELAAANPAAASGDATQSTPDATASTEVRCPACDNMNPADNAVCEVCGTELPGAQSTPMPAGNAAPLTMPTATHADDATADDAGNEEDSGTFRIPASAPPAGDGVASPPVDLQSDTTPLISTAPDVPAPQAPSLENAPATTAQPAPAGAPGDVAVVQTTMASHLEQGQVKLVVEQGMSVGKQFVLGDAEVAVGREDEDEEIYPDIDLSDQDEGYVHREHAKLNFSDGNLTVTHLGGANKTRVNNRPIADNEPQPLKLGDKVSFGKVVLRVLPI